MKTKDLSNLLNNSPVNLLKNAENISLIEMEIKSNVVKMYVKMEGVVGKNYKVSFENNDILITAVCESFNSKTGYKTLASIFTVPVDLAIGKAEHHFDGHELFIEIPRLFHYN